MVYCINCCWLSLECLRYFFKFLPIPPNPHNRLESWRWTRQQNTLHSLLAAKCKGWTSLIVTAFLNELEPMKLLLEAKANVNAADKQGRAKPGWRDFRMYERNLRSRGSGGGDGWNVLERCCISNRWLRFLRRAWAIWLNGCVGMDWQACVCIALYFIRAKAFPISFLKYLFKQRIRDSKCEAPIAREWILQG